MKELLDELRNEINDNLINEYSFDMFIENTKSILTKIDQMMEDISNNNYLIDEKNIDDFLNEINYTQILLIKYILASELAYDNNQYSSLYEIIPLFDFAIDDVSSLVVRKYNGKCDFDKSLDKIHNDMIKELEWAQ